MDRIGTTLHECLAREDGDWIVFSCPRCPAYERRLNWRTGEMRARNVEADVHHSGFFAPGESAPTGYLH